MLLGRMASPESLAICAWYPMVRRALVGSAVASSVMSLAPPWLDLVDEVDWAMNTLKAPK